MNGSATKAPRPMPYIILGLFGLYTLEFCVVGVMPQIMERFHVSASRAGLLMSLFALIVAISGPFCVLFASRFTRKKILTTALFAFSVCSLISGWAPNFMTLMASRIVPALLHPVFFSAAFAAAASFYPKEKEARAVSLAIVGTTLGLVLGVPMTTWIAAKISYQAAFGFCALVTALAGVGLLLKLPSSRPTIQSGFGEQLAILRKPALWLNTIATVFLFASMFSVYGYAAEYLRVQGGMDGATISAMLVLFGIGGVSGNLLAGRWLSANLLQTVASYPIVLALAYLILYFYASNAVVPMAFIVFFWGAAHTSGLVVGQIWLTSAASEAPEFGTSVYVSAANAGVVLGSAAGGYAIHAAGMQAALWCGWAFAAVGLAFILAKIILFAPACERLAEHGK